jgi:hypothetical protein
LAKSLCLCEIMQKRIPTDTRKSHFPTWGRRETGFVSKEKNLCQIPSATLLQAHKRIKFSHLHRVKLFFSYWVRNSAKKRLKEPQCGLLVKFHRSPLEVPPPPHSTSAQTTSRTLEYDNRLSKNWVSKKVAKRMNL